MSKIESVSTEVVSGHTTEEVIAFLARESKVLWRRANDPESDFEKVVIRDFSNWGVITTFLEALDKKLNGDKPTTVL